MIEKIDKELIKKLTVLSHYVDRDTILHQVSSDGEFLYFTSTRGKCDVKKCKAACCKVAILDSGFDEVSEMFADSKVVGKLGTYYVNKRCKNLDKNNKCKIHNTKKQLLCCKVFPNIDDIVYWAVFDKCTKYLQIDNKIKIINLLPVKEELVKEEIKQKRKEMRKDERKNKRTRRNNRI